MSIRLSWCLAIVFFQASGTHAAPEDDVRQLLEGVKEIGAPGAPGVLALVAPQARAVIVGGKDVQHVVVACSRWHKGRIVAWAHDGYFNPQELKVGHTGRLLHNAIAWAGGDTSTKNGMRVGVVNHPVLHDELKKNGVIVESLQGGAWHKTLGKLGVLIARVPDLNQGETRAAVKVFLENGGGLLIADTGWGWAQIHAAKSLRSDHPGNQLLYPAGILWTDGFGERTSVQGFQAGDLPAREVNAVAALDLLLQQNKGSQAKTADPRQAVASLKQAIPFLPSGDQVLLPKLQAARMALDRPAIPSAKTPIKAKDGLIGALVALDVHQMKQLPAREVQAHPAADLFPGAVHPQAKPVERTLNINTKVPDWHSTGLYAPAGKVLTITASPQAVKAGLKVRIGCHSDSLWQLKEWRRMPEVCRIWPVQTETLEIASAMGGLVYIDVPRKATLEPVEVRIQGAVPAPRFVLGKTTREDWLDHQCRLPGPWAELESSKLILTVPSRAIRELRDPVALMTFWDQVMDASADLARIPRIRPRPERFVVDEQIRAGYMHSGYPLMAHLDVENKLVDLPGLLSGKVEPVWGFFHEIGHNHQAPEWTFAGTGEVTVNLFTMYVFEKVVKKADMGLSLHNLLEPQRNQRIQKYLGKGAKFKDWQNDPFLALCMYIQLRQAFGWEAYQNVFEEYRQLPAQERPRTEEQKRDQWLIRFSRQVNKNLGPFFETWGVPTSAGARAEVANLPAWMPKNFPPK